MKSRINIRRVIFRVFLAVLLAAGMASLAVSTVLAAIDATSFSAKVNFGTGLTPYGLAIGDLDGDGKPDLAVANYGSNTVSVLRNTSTRWSISASSFAARVSFSTGTGPFFVAIRDLDGDGKPDLAVANSSSNTISVLRNTSTSGSVSFAAKVDFGTGLNPRGLAIGDLDGDGKPDLAVANSNSNTVSVLRNTSTSGSVSFNSKVDFPTESYPYSVAIGDLDGDGKLDLAVTNNNISGTVSVLRNTSTSGIIIPGSFAAKVDYGTGASPVSVAIGDLDGDGKPDLAVANEGSDTISVLRNTSISGSISFPAKVDFTTQSYPYGIAIGDLDEDGNPDLAVANNNSSGSVSVLRNKSMSGSISFAAKVDFGTGASPVSVAIGDLDGDSRLDLAVANNYSNTISVLRNSAKTILPQTGFSPGVITRLSEEPTIKPFQDLGDLWLEIPNLNIVMPIKGIPMMGEGWDVTWLGKNAGWLEGTAFPTWSGNSVITGHVWNADNTPGPFLNLQKLSWGDKVIVHAWGQEYMYEVRSVAKNVKPNSISSVLRHEEFPWLTLLTCSGYNEKSESYNYRLVVRAVQVSVK
jgi:LPXTG-site transpeptidase (sortase) family protein